MIHFSIKDHFKSFDGLFNGNKFSVQSCKLFCDEERLAQESLEVDTIAVVSSMRSRRIG